MSSSSSLLELEELEELLRLRGGKRTRLAVAGGGVGTLTASLDGLPWAPPAVFRGVVGGVTVTDRLGFRVLSGDGVFSTSTSLSDEDEEELLELLELLLELTEDVVVSRISRDIGMEPAPLETFAFFPLTGLAGLFVAAGASLLPELV